MRAIFKICSMALELLIPEVFAVRAIWDPKEHKHSNWRYIADKWEDIRNPANIRVSIQRWQNDVGPTSFCSLALRWSNVGYQLETSRSASRYKHTMAQRWTSVGNSAVGFQHYADGKPSVHSIGCDD